MYRHYEYPLSGNCHKSRLLLTQLGQPFDSVRWPPGPGIMDPNGPSVTIRGRFPGGTEPRPVTAAESSSCAGRRDGATCRTRADRIHRFPGVEAIPEEPSSG
jgi:hypothetical protein